MYHNLKVSNTQSIMLKKGRQRAYFNEVWQSMLAHLLAFCETQKQEELHQFRLQVKKIRALLLFLQGRSAIKPLKPLQAIFKQAGKIRSAHVNLAIIEQYQVADTEIENEQEKIANSESKRFCSEVGAHVKTLKKLRKALAAIFQDIENKAVVPVYKKQLKKLTRFFTRPNLPVLKLHQTRKKIKNLLYFCDVLPDSLLQKFQLNIACLDQLQEAIGQWHDVVVAFELLKTEGIADKKVMNLLERRRFSLFASIRALAADFTKKSVFLPVRV